MTFQNCFQVQSFLFLKVFKLFLCKSLIKFNHELEIQISIFKTCLKNQKHNCFFKIVYKFQILVTLQPQIGFFISAPPRNRLEKLSHSGLTKKSQGGLEPPQAPLAPPLDIGVCFVYLDFLDYFVYSFYMKLFMVLCVFIFVQYKTWRYSDLGKKHRKNNFYFIFEESKVSNRLHKYAQGTQLIQITRILKLFHLQFCQQKCFLQQLFLVTNFN
eukprot:TRINITY_DN12137_c0_g1_i12.p1 TRINITY_DN12137_c0_g1~~TRINITY_DN12137_c0_g1_i12.p1  ORF type:complete len:214 (-),score=-16.34 TRINITY_DN12137_c0_g1_i12:99-740(-)